MNRENNNIQFASADDLSMELQNGGIEGIHDLKIYDMFSPEDMLYPRCEIKFLYTDGTETTRKTVLPVIHVINKHSSLFERFLPKIYKFLNDKIQEYNQKIFPLFDQEADLNMLDVMYELKDDCHIHTRLLERTYPQPDRTLLVEPFVRLLTVHHMADNPDDNEVIKRWMCNLSEVKQEDVLHQFKMADKRTQDSILSLCFLLVERHKMISQVGVERVELKPIDRNYY